MDRWMTMDRWMSMDRTTLVHMARKHWSRWLPEKTAQLKAEKQFGEATLIAALLAQQEISELIAQGYQEHEAAEVARSLYILLQPEPDAVQED
jgi:hypothetical protein